MTKVVRPKMTSHIDLLTRTFCRRNWRGVSDTSRQDGMSAARQRLRRFGRATILRTCSAADYYVNATVSMNYDPL